jgi:hypothetical protein
MSALTNGLQNSSSYSYVKLYFIHSFDQSSFFVSMLKVKATYFVVHEIDFKNYAKIEIFMNNWQIYKIFFPGQSARI